MYSITARCCQNAQVTFCSNSFQFCTAPTCVSCSAVHHLSVEVSLRHAYDEKKKREKKTPGTADSLTLTSRSSTPSKPHT